MKKKILFLVFISSLVASGAMAAEIKKVESKKVKNDTKVESKIQKEKTLLEKLSSAKTEEERQKILSESKKEEVIFSERTAKIFENFDEILNKLEKVQTEISKNTDLLKTKKIDTEFLDEKNLSYFNHFNAAKTAEAEAWLKMQKIDFSQEKAIILGQLVVVKEDLIKSKEEIRAASMDLKEMISFVRGALAIFDK